MIDILIGVLLGFIMGNITGFFATCIAMAIGRISKNNE